MTLDTSVAAKLSIPLLDISHATSYWFNGPTNHAYTREEFCEGFIIYQIVRGRDLVGGCFGCICTSGRSRFKTDCRFYVAAC